jgi:hypothetical protein
MNDIVSTHFLSLLSSIRFQIQNGRYFCKILNLYDLIHNDNNRGSQ